MFRKCFLFITSSAILFMMFSCSATTGAKGTDGNANVIMYTFGSNSTSSGTMPMYTFPGDQTLMETSLILVYYKLNGSTIWYPAPGIGTSTDYVTRINFYLLTTNSIALYIRLVTITDQSVPYTTLTIFEKTRIIVAPASTVTAMSLSGGPDYSDCEAVMKYYGLKD